MRCEWKSIRAKDFCYIVTDGTHDSPKATENGHYLITSKHLTPYTIDFSSAKKISEEDYQKVIKRSSVEQWDILFSMIGTIGVTYLEKNIDIDYACKNMGIFKFNGDINKAYWLYYYLQTPQAKEYISGHSRGTTQQYLPLGSLRDFPIQITSSEICNKIISILKSLDDKIELNNAINKNLEQQAQAIFKSWFIDFDPFGGVCPTDWKKITLDEATSRFGTGLNPRKNFVLGHGNNYYVTIKNMGNNRIYLDDRCDMVDDEAIAKIQKRSDLQVGDLLFSGIGTIGRVYLIDKPPTNWNTSESIFNLRPNHLVSSEFLYLLLLSRDMQDYAISLASGSVQKGIRMADLKRYPFSLPSADVMKKFTELLSPQIKKIKSNEVENDKLAELRDSLLPRLMSGELDVSALDF